MEKTKVSSCEHENVENLKQLIEKANENNVES